MEQKITSGKNPLIRWMRSLSSPKARRESGAILVEGGVMIREALSCSLEPVCVLYEDPCLLEGLGALPEEARCALVPSSLLQAVCETVTPQGIAAAFRAPEPADPTDMRGPVVVLDCVQDPGNCGTIARTADAAGFGGIVFGTGSADPMSAKVIRSSMGSLFRLPYAQGDLAKIYPMLRQMGYCIAASCLDGESIYGASPLREPCALAIGNEASGISECTRREADVFLRIPMRGGAESLNASVAAGILMYEMTRPAGKAGS